MIAVKHAGKTENVRLELPVFFRKGIKVQVVADHTSESPRRRFRDNASRTRHDTPLQFPRCGKRFRIPAGNASVRSDENKRVEHRFSFPEFDRSGNRAAIAERKVAVQRQQLSRMMNALRLRHALRETAHPFAGDKKIDSGSIQPLLRFPELTERFLASLIAAFADVEMNGCHIKNSGHLYTSGGSAATTSIV